MRGGKDEEMESACMLRFINEAFFIKNKLCDCRFFVIKKESFIAKGCDSEFICILTGYTRLTF